MLDYGNEKESGEGVARAIKEGIVKREELFIVSKLWNSYVSFHLFPQGMVLMPRICSQHEPHRVKETCERSLKLWGIDYFDCESLPPGPYMPPPDQYHRSLLLLITIKRTNLSVPDTLPHRARIRRPRGPLASWVDVDRQQDLQTD
jgi:hypothetical protein